MGDYFVSQGGSRILNATRVDQSGADNTNVTAWTKANDFILAVNIYSHPGKDTVAAQYKLRWRDTDGGSFADVASTGTIHHSADTDLVNGANIVVGGRKCSTQGDTWQNGEEVEGAINSDSIDLATDYETEIHFALDCSGATDGHEYEFELFDDTLEVTRGTCGATISMVAGSWLYRKEITITGQSGAGTNYQVGLDIGASAGGDFHLEGHCTNFPQDIIVVDNDETTPLDYWIEDITADPLKMWVEVADDLGTNKTIYIYYGNSGATTNSDIEATMIFGDDFNDGSIDTTTRWNSYVNSPATIAETGGELACTTSGSTGQFYSALLSKSSFGVNNILECRSKSSDTAVHPSRYMAIGFGPYEGTVARYLKGQTAINDSVIFDDYSSSTNVWGYEHAINGSVTVTAGQAISSTYKKYTIERYDTNKARWLINDVQVKAETTTIPDNTQIAVGIDALSATGADFTMNVDWIYIRKYNSVEPAFSSAGSEQSLTTITSTDLLHGKIIIKDSVANQSDSKIKIQDIDSDSVDSKLQVLDIDTELTDGLLRVKDAATGLTDGKVQLLDTIINLVDGKVVISTATEDTDLTDGKIQIKNSIISFADSKIKIKDSITSLADGKVKIIEYVTNLADGKIQIKDVYTNIADCIVSIKDSVVNLFDAEVDIKNTSTDIADAKIRIKDSIVNTVDGLLRLKDSAVSIVDGRVKVKSISSDFADGKVEIADSDTDSADAKVQVKDSTVGTADARVKIIEYVTNLADSRIQIKNIATGLADGKVQIKDVTTGTVDGFIRLYDKAVSFLDGKIRLKDVDADVADGKVVITGAISTTSEVIELSSHLCQSVDLSSPLCQSIGVSSNIKQSISISSIVELE